LLDGWLAFDLLLRWEATIQHSTLRTSEILLGLARKDLTADALTSAAGLAANLEIIFKSLVKSQIIAGGHNENASVSLASVMTALISDQLEHASDISGMERHDAWLGQSLPRSASHQGDINGMLLIGNVPAGCSFSPGTIYEVTDAGLFETAFGAKTKALVSDCFDRQKDDEDETHCKRWKTKAKAIVVELSPDCDVQQGNRKTSYLIAGVMVSSEEGEYCRRADAWIKLPSIKVEEDAAQAEDDSCESGAKIDGRCVHFVFCARYKAALKTKGGEPVWLKPLFRLRDLPTASLRNWAAAQASRVGYISL
jgi:hypothetical protein